eukprot:1149426-Pelagomonas_calceolata.AAC.1
MGSKQLVVDGQRAAWVNRAPYSVYPPAILTLCNPSLDDQGKDTGGACACAVKIHVRVLVLLLWKSSGSEWVPGKHQCCVAQEASGCAWQGLLAACCGKAQAVSGYLASINAV